MNVGARWTAGRSDVAPRKENGNSRLLKKARSRHPPRMQKSLIESYMAKGMRCEADRAKVDLVKDVGYLRVEPVRSTQNIFIRIARGLCRTLGTPGIATIGRFTRSLPFASFVFPFVLVLGGIKHHHRVTYLNKPNAAARAFASGLKE